MLHFREWPSRALETVYQMVRHSLFDAMREMEDRRVQPSAILMSRDFREFWDAHHRMNNMYMPTAQFSAEIGAFYGVPIHTDRFLDQRAGQNGHTVADARVVAHGYGSVPVRLEVLDMPDRLAYGVEVQAGLDRMMRRREQISYNVMRQDRPAVITPEQHEARLRRLNEMDRMVREVRPMQHSDVVISGYEAKRQPKKEMSDLLIAWNT